MTRELTCSTLSWEESCEDEDPDEFQWSSMPDSKKGVFTHTYQWRSVYLAVYFIAGSRVLWTVLRVPMWWGEILDCIGLPWWLFGVPFAIWVLLTGPARVLANDWMCAHPALKQFVNTIKDESIGKDSFQKQFQNIASNWVITTVSPQWFVGYIFIPTVGFWLISLPHWHWCMVFLLIPEAIRAHITGFHNSGFDVALLASKFRADLLISQIETPRSNAVEYSAPSSWQYDVESTAPFFWQSMCAAHQKFDEDMGSLWKVVFPHFTIMLLDFGAAMSSMALAGITSGNTEIPYIFFSTVVGFGILLLMTLKPMADITGLCQNMGTGCKSIKKAASSYAGLRMGSETCQQYMQFMQHLDRTPTGVTFPVIGQLNYAFLVSKGTLLATVIPTVLTFARLQVLRQL